MDFEFMWRKLDFPFLELILFGFRGSQRRKHLLLDLSKIYRYQTFGIVVTLCNLKTILIDLVRTTMYNASAPQT